MDANLITVIIPSFNKGDFISETLNSLLEQVYSNWEAIIVDDGSTDSSIQIIRDYCSKDVRFKLIQRNTLPKGGSACRNIGIKNSKGYFIIFLDADDLLSPLCIKRRLSKALESPDNNFWVFPIETFETKPGDNPKMWIPSGKKHLLKFLRHQLPWHTMSPIWRKSFLMEVNGYDAEFPRLQDVELHTRAIIFSKYKYKTYPKMKADGYYRINPERSKITTETQLENYIDGVFLYFNKTLPILESGQQRKNLKGTLFTLQTNINYRCTVKEQKLDFHKIATNRIQYFMSQNNLFNINNFSLFKLYNHLYLIGFWKIKGFNHCFKNCFIHC